MTTTKAEILAQAEALRRIPGDVTDLIRIYGEDFRRIIRDYEAAHGGRAPTADDLIWIESEHQRRDITRP